MLPLNRSTWLHLIGRGLRFALERAGETITFASGGKLNGVSYDGIQWRRWLALDQDLQRGIIECLGRSHVFDRAAHEAALAELKHSGRFSGTRFMLTASCCLYYT
jgi:hypothetical protein